MNTTSHPAHPSRAHRLHSRAIKSGMAIFCGGAFLLSSLSTTEAQNLLSNGEFEPDVPGWSLVIPPESSEAECRFEMSQDKPPQGGLSGRLSSTSEVRFGIVTRPKIGALVAGERFRVSAWVRADKDFVAKAGTPGFVLRVTLFSNPKGNEDTPGGHYYLGLGNRLTRGYSVSPLLEEAIPGVWTKIEAILEIPPETVTLDVSLFVWFGSGALYVGNIVFEPVDDTTPLTPLLD